MIRTKPHFSATHFATSQRGHFEDVKMSVFQNQTFEKYSLEMDWAAEALLAPPSLFIFFFTHTPSRPRALPSGPCLWDTLESAGIS